MMASKKPALPKEGKKTDAPFSKPFIPQSPASGSPMARFLAEPMSPPPPETPTKPKAMGILEKAQASAEKIKKEVMEKRKMIAKNAHHGRAKSPGRTLKIEEAIVRGLAVEDKVAGNTRRAKSPTPTRKRRRDIRHSPPPRARKAARGMHDHYSPRAFRRLCPLEAPRLVPPMHTPSQQTRSSSPTLARSSPVKACSPVASKISGPVSVAIPEIVIVNGTLCLNCGKKNHSFMDCMIGCGRCGKDGHRTIHCGLALGSGTKEPKKNGD